MVSQEDSTVGEKPYELRDKLGDTWGEKVLVKKFDGEAVDYYAAVPGKNHLREAWTDHSDDPVWMHVNEVGYCLQTHTDRVSWEIVDWEDAPVSTVWEVEYPA